MRAYLAKWIYPMFGFPTEANFDDESTFEKSAIQLHAQLWHIVYKI